MLKKLQNYKNIGKLFFSLFLFSIISIGTFADSQLKEIPILDENFISENTNVDFQQKQAKLKNDNLKEISIEKELKHSISEEKNVLDNIEETTKFKKISNPSKEIFPIETVDSNKKIEKKELINKNIENEKVKKLKIKKAPKKIKKTIKPILKNKKRKVNWNLKNNFRACLIGDSKGHVYFSKNADKLYPLASVTKVMTLLITFDAIHAKKISLNSRVTISANAARQGGSKIRLKAGQVYRLKDLIKASAIYSANNTTYAIAEFVGQGSLKRFVRLMNKKVRKLGLQKSLKYYTPAGLPSRMTKKPMDSGTARAIYKLSIEALKYKDYLQIAGIKRTTIRNGKIKLRNRNHLLGKHGVYGIKTGYHKEARYNITVASKIKNKRVIVVVLGGKTYKTRDKTVLDMLDIFEENYYTLTKK